MIFYFPHVACGFGVATIDGVLRFGVGDEEQILRFAQDDDYRIWVSTDVGIGRARVIISTQSED